jgi:hypothetical protein
VNKTAVALALVVCIAAVATVVVYVVKSRQPAQGAAQGDEFGSVENQLNELDNFLGFEDQMFDYDLSQIAGDWG